MNAIEKNVVRNLEAVIAEIKARRIHVEASTATYELDEYDVYSACDIYPSRLKGRTVINLVLRKK